MWLKLKNIFLLKYKTLLFILFESIFISFFPLVNVFSYEFAVIQGIVLSLVFGFFAINYRLQKREINLRSTIFELILMLFIPIVISVISTLIGQKCPLCGGFQFYFVITLPSAVFGLALGIYISAIFNKKGKTIFLLFWLAVLLLPVAEIFFNPQIYIFNPILGFFPGTIYDEDIAVSLKLISYRVIILIFSSLLIWVSVKFKNFKKLYRIIFLFSIIIVVSAFLTIKPELGFSSTVNSIKSELKGQIETPHFNIIYSSKIPKKKIENIALHHEYYYTVLSAELHDSVSGKITSFVFYDNYEKRKLFGAGNADVAKPWLRQIYTSREHFDSTLKHELAHVFSANYGWSIFKVAKDFNPAMIEGFAMALQNNFGNSDIDYIAANAKHNGIDLNINDLFSGFNFFEQTSSISYIYAGSFIKFLLNKYGAEHVKKVYGDLNFKLHFKKNLSQLASEFESYLNTIKTDLPRAKTQLYFKRKPIQRRICVRYTANKLNEAWRIYSLGAYYDAAEMFSEIYKYSGAYSALLGKVLSLKSNDYLKRAENLLQQNAVKFEGTSYSFSLLKNLGDLQILNNHFKDADSTFLLLKKMRPSQDYYDVAILRLALMKSDSLLAKNYISAGIFDKYSILKYKMLNKIPLNIIPIMITLSADLKENYKKFIFDYKKIGFDSTYTSSYSAFKLSKYAKDNDDFLSAVYFARKSLLLQGRTGFKKILKANLEKDLWMLLNSELYYKKFKFIYL